MIHSNSFLSATKYSQSSENDFLALIILNSDAVNQLLLERLWETVDLKICADGGANRLFDMYSGNNSDRLKYIPNLIKGDFDSIRHNDVLPYYKNQGVSIIHDTNQDTTDLEKCLEELSASTSTLPSRVDKRTMTILIVGGFDGSFHHDLGNIHLIHRYATVFRRMLLIGKTCMAELLIGPNELTSSQIPCEGACSSSSSMLSTSIPLQQHILRFRTPVEGPTCGLYPIKGTCQLVHSTGLKWNLEHKLSFGEFISTSNQIINYFSPPRQSEDESNKVCSQQSSEVIIHTSDCVLITWEYEI